MIKTIKKSIFFLFCWALWAFPAIEDLQESGPGFAGITCLFLSVATVLLVAPFLFWTVVWVYGEHTILGFFPVTLPVGFGFYLVIGVIYHLGVGYGGSAWYRNYKNLIFEKPSFK